jgi:hypothetical protein
MGVATGRRFTFRSPLPFSSRLSRNIQHRRRRTPARDTYAKAPDASPGHLCSMEIAGTPMRALPRTVDAAVVVDLPIAGLSRASRGVWHLQNRRVWHLQLVSHFPSSSGSTRWRPPVLRTSNESGPRPRRVIEMHGTIWSSPSAPRRGALPASTCPPCPEA